MAGVAVAGALVLLGGVGGWQGWRWYELRQDRAVAGVYLTAMQDADGAAAGLAPGENPARAQAVEGFAKVAAQGPAGYRTLARLREAALVADGGNRAAAVALWEQVADDGSADRLLRDLASLMLVEHQLDNGDPAQLQARLAPLAVPNNSWHAMAQEAQALLDLRQGQTDTAKQVLRGLAQDTTAPSGCARASQRPAGTAGGLMTRSTMTQRGRRATAVGRRAALLMPLASLAGCSLFEDMFFASKTPMPGRREDLMAARHGLELAPGTPPRVVLPPAVANAEWPQPGGNPAHLMGHLAAGERLAQLWSVSIGEGGGYRRKVTSQPVIAGGRVMTMDSDGQVCAFDAASGRQAWSFDTQPRKNRSTNVGGGVAVDGGVVYASTGRAEVLALDAASGAVKWRQPLGSAGAIVPDNCGRADLRLHA